MLLRPFSQTNTIRECVSRNHRTAFAVGRVAHGCVPAEELRCPLIGLAVPPNSRIIIDNERLISNDTPLDADMRYSATPVASVRVGCAAGDAGGMPRPRRAAVAVVNGGNACANWDFPFSPLGGFPLA